MATFDAARSELAPTGRIRIGIVVSPAASAIFAIRDAASGTLRGVTIDLGRALGQRIGAAVQFVEYASSGAITAAAASGEWDVTFIPVDDERRKSVNFGSPFHVMQSTYLTAPGSTIASLDQFNQAGLRIVGVEGTATLRASVHASRNATHLAVRSPQDAIELLRSGKADALAMGRESLAGVQSSLPGSRLLEGGFLNSTTAVAVPKNRPAALASVSEFIEEAKASGLVRRALDAAGLTNSVVAPAGMKP